MVGVRAGVESSLRVKLLGPIQVLRDDVEVPLRSTRLQCVVGVLATRLGGAVSRAELVDAIWGDQPPASVENAIHVYIARLRRALEPERSHRVPATLLVWTGSGYLLRLRPDALDVHAFDTRRDQARRAQAAGDLEGALRGYDTALELWRGTPWSRVPGPFAGAERTRLVELRLTVFEARAEILLGLGRHAELAAELPTLIASHPLREQLRALLMRALYNSGRQAEALRVFRETRKAMVAELAIEPGPELQQLHRQILAADLTLTPRPRTEPAEPIPRQLPADIVDFTGREQQLADLDALLDGGCSQTAVISAIGGAAGVGKTTLAVHWAHRVAERFPGGQLYINLRGFDPSGSTMSPADAIRAFVDAFDVPPQRIPAGYDAQVALYRSLLATRRTLVVLDNARDAEQVRPLLPGAPGSLVVITSRDQLAGLVATQGAYPLTLDLFSAAESHEFLARRLGAERVSAQTAAADEIVTRCARLPLALAIAATRAATRRDLPLADLAAELRAAHGRLDAFDIGDLRADVRAVFSWSYERVSPPAARLFRLLGLHPGPDISVAAAASLAGVPRSDARSLLGELARAQLVVEYPAGRYTQHDLLHAYAVEQTQRLEPDEQVHTATNRMLDHYLHTTHAAALCLQPERQRLPLPAPQPGVVLDELTDSGHALSWVAAERPILLAAVDRASRAGLDAHAMQLARSLSLFLDRGGHWHDQARILEAALHPAQRLGDQAGQADVQRNLGGAYTQLQRFDDAELQLRHSLRLFGELDEPAWQAHSHVALGWLCVVRGRYRDALSHAEQALVLFRAAGDERLQADALNNIGWAHAQLGDLRQALSCCQDALDRLQKLDERHGQADTWDSLGYIRHHLGQHRQAKECYQQALDLYRETGDRLGAAQTLDRLGDTHQASGDLAAARIAWKDALTILDELDHQDAAAVRRKCEPDAW